MSWWLTFGLGVFSGIVICFIFIFIWSVIDTLRGHYIE
jgi:cytochrome bd-type quinol oxidase subunit 1